MVDRSNDPFGRGRLPETFSREQRIRLLAEVAHALLDGRTPSRPAALFLASALSAWLAQGGTCGSLERDFLKVAAPRRSTLTPGRLWARMREGSAGRTTDDDADGTMGTDIDNPEGTA